MIAYFESKRIDRGNQRGKIFISVEKDTNRNFILFYKKKFHCNAFTITDHLVAVLLKQINKNILYIFNPYHQTLAQEVIWNEDSIPKHREEQELDEDLDNQLDWIKIMKIQDDISNSNKYSLEEVEEMSINIFTTAATI